MCRWGRYGWAMITVAAGALGCEQPGDDGQVGEQGLVRFAQVVKFAETDDFRSPIAAGSSMVIALQRPSTGFLDDDTFVSLRLDIRRLNGDSVGSVIPLGFAQYGVQFQESGTLQLVAERADGQAIDGITVSVRPFRGIGLSPRFVVTTRTEIPAECSRVDEYDDLAQVLLHTNQSLQVFVVPRDEDQRPMLGLLALTAEAPSSVTLDAPIVGANEFANTLVVTPEDRLPTDIPIRISEVTTGQDIEFTVQTRDQMRPLDCR